MSIEKSTNIDDIYPAPWDRGEWNSADELISVDGCPTNDFDKPDVEEVLAHWSDDNYWDGDTAGLIRLRDGRFVGWESWWDSTEDGFSAVIFGLSIESVLMHIGEDARGILESMVSK